mmetsp:Transcript_28457/g.85271  ORF Transcript_28457/g.85271 Transcript_28457/m.85271 type:complete len:168 (+) Transcript_28457:3255-3758(+)
MLGFAEWSKKFPNPHTKYDKVWIENCADMTVAELATAVGKAFGDANLEVTAILGPDVQIEVPVTEENPSGVESQARALYNPLLPSTKANADKKWVPLLKEFTTKTEEFKLLNDPIDVSTKLLYAGLTFIIENEDGDEITVPSIVLKLGDFPFVPYNKRVEKPAVPWL